MLSKEQHIVVMVLEQFERELCHTVRIFLLVFSAALGGSKLCWATRCGPAAARLLGVLQGQNQGSLLAPYLTPVAHSAQDGNTASQWNLISDIPPMLLPVMWGDRKRNEGGTLLRCMAELGAPHLVQRMR